MATILDKKFLGVLVALGVAVAGGWWFYPAGSERRATVPVIVYLVDTLRADRLGVYGYSKRGTSPNLDRLAADSVVFTNAYAPAPWTVPSVISLVTSTFSCEHGVVTELQKIDPEQRTLAERMSEANYFTMGRYGNHFVGPMTGLDRGFDIYQKKSSEYDDDMAGLVEELLVNRPEDRPFFLYVHTMEPHDPYNTPNEHLRVFGHVNVDQRAAAYEANIAYRRSIGEDPTQALPTGTLDTAQQVASASQALVEQLDIIDLLYDASVHYADANVADLIDRLRRLDIWDTAIFVFLSDHGEEFYDHGTWFHEQSLYEEVARVPLIIHFPHDEFGGSRVEATVSLVDVMPTLFDYIGRPDLCAGCRGTSLLRLIGHSVGTDARSREIAVRDNRRLHDPTTIEKRGNLNVAVREADWKAIWNRDNGSIELYDLSVDPFETSDQSAIEPELAARLLVRAQEWYAECSANAFVPVDTVLDEETIRQLRSLGYL